ncbi:FAD-dependent oxidoreductase [Kutzneria kofuensis]|uniref:FAD-dependent oxidoreductase n=1 Tax=Kutzneria kofuensis TaxID=103725 RepID=UPI0031ED93BC
MPGLPNLPDGVGAWSCHGCQHADVSALTQRLARRLRPRVRFAEGTRVTEIVPASGRSGCGWPPATSSPPIEWCSRPVRG